MRKIQFWKLTLGLFFISKAFGSGDIQVSTLSEGSCWYDTKEMIKVSSFNDKTSYSARKSQIDSELETLISQFAPNEHIKFNETDLVIHCGGYGASLVAKIYTDINSYCLWTKFDKGILKLRSVGVLNIDPKNTSDVCSGHKMGEFIVGVESEELIVELQASKWSSMIKSISPISHKTYKILLTNDFRTKEREVIDQLQNNFSSSVLKYIEFNDYQHPIGESVHLDLKGQ